MLGEGGESVAGVLVVCYLLQIANLPRQISLLRPLPVNLTTQQYTGR